MISNIRTNLDNSGLFYGSGNLLKDLIDYVFNKSISKKKHKIMFIGDQAQLPPINCSNSPALEQKILSEYFNLSQNLGIEFIIGNLSELFFDIYQLPFLLKGLPLAGDT